MRRMLVASILLVSFVARAAAQKVTLGSPPSPNNILLVSSTGNTTAAAVTLSEFQSSTPGAAVQSVGVPGCFLTPIVPQQCYGSVSTNGLYAMFPCGSTTSSTRYIARVTATGLVDTRCVPSAWGFLVSTMRGA